MDTVFRLVLDRNVSRSFDVIWALESVVHTERKSTFLQEAHHLLCDGGRLLISEYLLRGTPPLSEEEHSSLTPWLKGWAMASLFTASDYCRLLAETGFQHVHIYDLTDHVRRSVNYLGKLRLPTMPTASIVLALASALHIFHLMSAERVNNFKAGLCQNKALGRELWSYGVLVAEKSITR